MDCCAQKYEYFCSGKDLSHASEIYFCSACSSDRSDDLCCAADGYCLVTAGRTKQLSSIYTLNCINIYFLKISCQGCPGRRAGNVPKARGVRVVFALE